jgi:Fur family iron response transcriptional regulator
MAARENRAPEFCQDSRLAPAEACEQGPEALHLEESSRHLLAPRPSPTQKGPSRRMTDLISQDEGYGSSARQGCPFHDVRQRLRRVGLRPTRQRVSLGWLLFAKGDRHISAEMLYEEAMKARVPVSLATVYNTLHQFTQAGLLRELAIDGAKTYFDTDNSEHHHFVVDGENTVIDIPASAVDVAELPEPPAGYEIARVDVVVRLRKIAG